MLKTKIETERLLLRRWKESDFSDFCEFTKDPEVMMLSGGKPAETDEEALKVFEKEHKDKESFAIILKSENKAIGQIKYQDDFRRYKINSISIGYELNRSYWGKGYMTEALQAMVSHAFEKRKVDIIGIAHFSVNTKSRRVIEKCGFKHEGTLPKAFKRFDGVEFDDESYSLLKEDYFAAKEKNAQ